MATLTVEDLHSLAWTDVVNPLPKEQLYAAIQTPPFIYIPGTFNTRDVGLIPGGNPGVRPGYVFRTGALSSLTPEGKQLLASKGIKKIFDLRSLDEHSKEPDPADIPGVDVMWTPPKEARAHADLSPFVEGEGEKGYAAMYMAVLDEYRDNIRQVLEHVRDAPGEPFIFHCTGWWPTPLFLYFKFFGVYNKGFY